MFVFFSLGDFLTIVAILILAVLTFTALYFHSQVILQGERNSFFQNGLRNLLGNLVLLVHLVSLA